MRLSRQVYLDSYESGIYADEVYVKRREIYSCVLGLDGYPLPYEDAQVFGFDLTKRKKINKG